MPTSLCSSRSSICGMPNLARNFAFFSLFFCDGGVSRSGVSLQEITRLIKPPVQVKCSQSR